MPAPLIFEKGFVLCYRIFDVAEEIALEPASRLLAEDARRLKFSRVGSQYLRFADPPLSAELGKRALALRPGTTMVDGVARIFDHGAISVILRVPVPAGTSMHGLVVLADELYDSPAADRLALELLEGLRHLLAPVLVRPHLWEQSESYTIIFVQEIAGHPSASELLERADLARLLLGETDPEPLSARESNVTRKQQMLAQVYQLLKGEIDTDRSLTLEITIVILIISELLLAIASVFSRP